MLADDLFLHGHSLSRWVVDYVDLEESLSAGTIAQDDLAHAVALWEAAGRSAPVRDDLVYERGIDEWHASPLGTWAAHDWPEVVARGVVLAVIARHILDNDSVVDRAVRAEQAIHDEHWRRWTSILIGDDELRSAFLTAVSEALGRGAVYGNAWQTALPSALRSIDPENTPFDDTREAELDALLTELRAVRAAGGGMGTW